MSGQFQARYASRCGYGDAIRQGDSVRYDADGDLVHTACEDSPPATSDAPRRNERTCPSCFTIHAGACL